MIPQKIKAIILFSIMAGVIILILVLSMGSSDGDVAIGPAPQFSTTDIDGNNISLKDYEGKIVVLHIMFLTPDTCPYCRVLNEAQLKELKTVYSNKSSDDFEFITINMPPASTSDNVIIEERNKQGISWPMINDPFVGSNTDRHFDETEIGGKYIKYLMEDKATYLINPTIILINKQQDIVGVYHPGKLDHSKISLDSTYLSDNAKDNLVSAKELEEKIERLRNDEWGSTMEGKILTGVTLTGIFMLGLLVSITPCALMLLMIMTAYVAGVSKKQQENQEKAKNDALEKRSKTGHTMIGDTSGSRPKSKESDVWLGATIGLAFTLGMGIIFFIEGCLFTYIGVFMRNAVVFDLILGILLIAISIHLFFGLDKIYKYFKNKNISADSPSGEEKESLFEKGRALGMRLVEKSVVLGAVFLGMLLALGWAPCVLSFVSPILLWLTTQNMPVIVGGLYLFVFSLGYGVPVIVVSALTGTVRNKLASKFTSVGKFLPKVFAVLILGFAILMILRFFGMKFW